MATPPCLIWQVRRAVLREGRLVKKRAWASFDFDLGLSRASSLKADADFPEFGLPKDRVKISGKKGVKGRGAALRRRVAVGTIKRIRPNGTFDLQVGEHVVTRVERADVQPWDVDETPKDHYQVANPNPHP